MKINPSNEINKSSQNILSKAWNIEINNAIENLKNITSIEYIFYKVLLNFLLY
jgi:hypothetical protein